MEKELFNEHLNALYERFGRDTAFTSLKQAAKYCREDPRTLLADKTFPIKKQGRLYKVSIINFARWLA